MIAAVRRFPVLSAAMLFFLFCTEGRSADILAEFGPWSVSCEDTCWVVGRAGSGGSPMVLVVLRGSTYAVQIVPGDSASRATVNVGGKVYTFQRRSDANLHLPGEQTASLVDAFKAGRSATISSGNQNKQLSLMGFSAAMQDAHNRAGTPARRAETGQSAKINNQQSICNSVCYRNAGLLIQHYAVTGWTREGATAAGTRTGRQCLEECNRPFGRIEWFNDFIESKLAHNRNLVDSIRRGGQAPVSPSVTNSWNAQCRPPDVTCPSNDQAFCQLPICR